MFVTISMFPRLLISWRKTAKRVKVANIDRRKTICLQYRSSSNSHDIKFVEYLSNQTQPSEEITKLGKFFF